MLTRGWGHCVDFINLLKLIDTLYVGIGGRSLSYQSDVPASLNLPGNRYKWVTQYGICGCARNKCLTILVPGWQWHTACSYRLAALLIENSNEDDHDKMQ